jgi:Uma2 family endonuclease
MTAGAPVAAPVTAEGLYDLPDDGWRYELVAGELRRMPPAGFEHGAVAMSLGRRVANFVADDALGVVTVAETGFVLAPNPDTVLAPDVAFVRAARAPTGDAARKFAELAPDLVVEVVSRSDRPGEVTEKALRWVEAGVRLTWVVHPDQRTVAVYEPGGVVHLVRAPEELDGGDVLPGFRVAVADLFPSE